MAVLDGMLQGTVLQVVIEVEVARGRRRHIGHRRVGGRVEGSIVMGQDGWCVVKPVWHRTHLLSGGIATHLSSTLIVSIVWDLGWQWPAGHEVGRHDSAKPMKQAQLKAFGTTVEGSTRSSKGKEQSLIELEQKVHSALEHMTRL